MSTTTSTMQQVGAVPVLEVPRAVAAVAVARTYTTAKERTSSPSRRQLNIAAPPLSPTSPSRHNHNHSKSSSTSPRLCKKLQRLEAAQASKQEQQAGRNRDILGLLVAFYLVIALCFCLPFFKDPSKARQLMKEASLAEQKHQHQLHFAPKQQQHVFNAQVLVQQQQQQTDSPVSTTASLVATTISTTPTTCPQQPQQCGTPQLHQQCVQQQQQQPNPFAQPASSVTETRKQVTFEHGRVGEFPYYRCSSIRQNQTSSNNNQSSRDMVILDGKSFFPELPVAGSGISLEQNIQEHLNANAQVIWKLCNQASRERLLDSITVVSFDGSEEIAQLAETLQGLRRAGKVAQLPVAALVTPGASASLLMDWILYGDWTSLQERVASHWIPVSAGASMLQALGMDDDDDYDEYCKGSLVVDDNLFSEAVHHHPLRVIDDWPTLALHCAAGDELSVRAAHILQQQTHQSQVRSVPGSGVDCFMDRSGDGATVLLDYLRPQLLAAHE